MRVLYLTVNPNLGASARVLPDWVRLGRAAGVEFAFVVPRRGLFSDWLAAEGVAHRVSRMPWPDRWRPWRAVRPATAVWWWARSIGCDLIHCEHDTYPFALLVSRLSGWSIVCQVHCAVSRPFAEWAFGRRVPGMLLWTTTRQAEAGGRVVTGIVPADRQQVIPLGVSLSRFGGRTDVRAGVRAGWGVRPGEVVVGSACALRPGKRIEDFLALVAELVRTDDRVVGVLAGDGVPGTGEEWYRDRVVKRIETAGLGRRFRWVGHLDDIEPFYHGVDVMVSTSESESFGMSVCEAMACRRPVAAYEAGSVGEVVGDAGLTVPTGDLAGLVRAVRELVDRPGLRAELGERARARVAASYDPADSVQLLADAYRRVVAERGQREWAL